MFLLRMLSSIFSVFDRGSYYANYEKAFAKLEKEEAVISKRTQSRTARRRMLTMEILYFGSGLTLLAALYAAWVFRQGFDAYTSQGRLLRLSGFLLIPLAALLCHHVVLFCFEVMNKWDDRILKKIHKSRDDMLRDIKDRNRFSKIQELLQKYDPEEQKKAALLEKLKTAPTQPQGHTPRKPSIGGSLFLGAGKIIDSIANGIIGDQPELLAEVEALRSMMTELEQKNEALKSENQQLKQQITSFEQSPQVQEDTSGTSAQPGNHTSVE